MMMIEDLSILDVQPSGCLSDQVWADTKQILAQVNTETLARQITWSHVPSMAPNTSGCLRLSQFSRLSTAQLCLWLYRFMAPKIHERTPEHRMVPEISPSPVICEELVRSSQKHLLRASHIGARGRTAVPCHPTGMRQRTDPDRRSTLLPPLAPLELQSTMANLLGVRLHKAVCGARSLWAEPRPL